MIDGPLQMTSSRLHFQSESNYGLVQNNPSENEYRSSNPPLNTVVDIDEEKSRFHLGETLRSS